MRCDDVRLNLSARLDGERPDPALAPAELDRHLAGCSACQAWLAGAERVTRGMRLRSVEVPDLLERILAAAYADRTLPVRDLPRRGRLSAAWSGRLRVILGALAVLQLAIAVPELFGIDGLTGHDAHAGREVAAFDIALAVGLLVVACYPEHARVFAPVVLALVVCFAAISALDVMQGVVTPNRVAIHTVAVLQAVAVWLLTRPRTGGWTPARVAEQRRT